jgi:hypothetical protein
MKIKKILWVILVTVMMTTAITPIAIAENHSETIHVTFTPSGDIDLDVFPITATFGTVVLESTDEYPDEGAGDTDYTVYNNGSTNAVVYIFSNTTTDSGEWTLDNGGSPGEDEFSLDVTGSDLQQITNSNTSWISDLNDGSTVTFGINLDLGTASGSGQLDAQVTTINITATIKA